MTYPKNPEKAELYRQRMSDSMKQAHKSSKALKDWVVESNKENDAFKGRLAKECGYRLLRIWEHDKDIAVKKILEFCTV